MFNISDVKKRLAEIEGLEFEAIDGEKYKVSNLEVDEDDGSVSIKVKDAYDNIRFNDKNTFATVCSYLLLKEYLIDTLKQWYFRDDLMDDELPCLYKSNKELIEVILSGKSGYTAHQWFTNVPEDDETIEDAEYAQKLFTTNDRLISLMIDYATIVRVIQTMFGNIQFDIIMHNEFEFDICGDTLCIGEECFGEDTPSHGYETEEAVAKDPEGWAIQLLKDVKEFCENM